MISRSSLVLLTALTLLGAGCSSTTTTSTPVVPENRVPAPSPSAQQPNQPTPSSMVSACDAVNKTMIQQTLGMTVGDGQTQPSGMQGTTCVFTGEGIIPDSVNVQFSPKADVFYTPSAWEGTEAISGYATGNLRGPNDGSTTAVITKNGKLAMVSVYSGKNTVSKAQFVNLLKAIAAQF